MCRLAAFILLGVLLGCASSGNELVVGEPPPSAVPIDIENGTGTPFRVFVAAGNNEWLLGRVDALRTVRLRLPGGLSGAMALIVRPAAASQFGDEHMSEHFSVAVGQRVNWQLRAPVGTVVPRISNIYIYACEEGGC